MQRRPRISSKSDKGSGPGNGELIRDERQAQSPYPFSPVALGEQTSTAEADLVLVVVVVLVLLSAVLDVGFRIPHIRNSSKPSPRVRVFGTGFQISFLCALLFLCPPSLASASDVAVTGEEGV